MPRAANSYKPYWTTSDGGFIRLYQGHVINCLQQLPAGSVQMAVTSPPYWGLRSYLGDGHDAKHLELGSELVPDCLGWARGCNCAEHNWANGCFICRMVLVFRAVRRVLRDDGTLWLNMGDSYRGSKANGGVFSEGREYGHGSKTGGKERWADGHKHNIRTKAIIKPGNLIGMPWRLALALQADGWVLRQDIVWQKPSPMPESCTNRCTKAHEYLFLFAKQKGYYYDAEAIKEPSIRAGDVPGGDYNKSSKPDKVFGQRLMADGTPAGSHPVYDNRNKRSVWTIASEAYPGAHYATFPTKLIEPCVKAGTSERGCCAACGAPYARVVAKQQLKRYRPNDYVKRTGAIGTGNSCANTVDGVSVRTLGWEETCNCNADIAPCVVLDPFCGSGTTNAVAALLGRASMGIDLSEDYLRNNAIPRIESALIARPATAYLLP
jgi:DNA modification methylase